MIGKAGKVGFLIGSEKRGEATTLPIKANQVNKYMRHFWGKENDIIGDFKVVGINEKGEEHHISSWKQFSVGISTAEYWSK
ncbi:hypothetical protein [Solibacillus sp. FSL K6-1523]|uniref:hypothetical protein n=1 Tax=Solibacillus sp. FSL K6-1523 TaxID=2921471 RepID=UPI0030F730BF